jgi:hypothetical protein
MDRIIPENTPDMKRELVKLTATTPTTRRKRLGLLKIFLIAR